MILIMLYQKDKGTSLKFLFWIMLDIYKRAQNSELDLQTTKIFLWLVQWIFYHILCACLTF